MKLIDELVAHGEAANQRAGQIADQQEAALNRRKAYNGLEKEFEQMAADGYLDKDEVGRLMAEFRELGLDTSTLAALAKDLNGRDSAGRVGVTAELRDLIGEQLSEARSGARDDGFMFEAQRAINENHLAYDTASRVSKAENEIYMVAIRHLAC